MRKDSLKRRYESQQVWVDPEEWEAFKIQIKNSEFSSFSHASRILCNRFIEENNQVDFTKKIDHGMILQELNKIRTGISVNLKEWASFKAAAAALGFETHHHAFRWVIRQYLQKSSKK